MEWGKEIVCCYRLHEGNSFRRSERMTAGHLFALQKLYRNNNLPQEVLANQEQVFHNFYYYAALRAYASNDFRAGNEFMEKFIAGQEWNKETKRSFVIDLGESLCNPILTADPINLIEKIWDTLSNKLLFLKPMKPLIYASVARRRFFDAFQQNDRKRMGVNLLKVVFYDSTLVDRGIVKIFFRSFFSTITP